MHRSEMSWIIQAATMVAVKAGEGILSGRFAGQESDSNEGEEKGDPNVGHHAIVTRSDTGAQKFILTQLASEFPEARFIGEEKSDILRDRIVRQNQLDTLVEEPLVIIVDPIDGSSSYKKTIEEWGVSIGPIFQGLHHQGGAIYCPDVRDGMLVYGERGKGVFLREGRDNPRPVSVVKQTRKNAYIYIGPDIFFMLDRFGRFLNAASKEIRTTNCSGSCVMSLAKVAAGKVDALIQPVQCPWDWAAGFPLVEEAGGKFLFYNYESGRPEQIERTTAVYSPVQRNAAFIAGAPDIVDWLWELLQKHWDAWR
jgi:myo-inositol-1(or 4)-monophosphatase